MRRKQKGNKRKIKNIMKDKKEQKNKTKGSQKKKGKERKDWTRDASNFKYNTEKKKKKKKSLSSVSGTNKSIRFWRLLPATKHNRDQQRHILAGLVIKHLSQTWTQISLPLNLPAAVANKPSARRKLNK